MGSWGVGPFDNDAADDFAIEVDEAPEADQLRMLRAALLAVGGSKDSVDAFDALPAVAAAALVKKLLDKVRDHDIVTGIQEWLAVEEQLSSVA